MFLMYFYCNNIRQREPRHDLHDIVLCWYLNATLLNLLNFSQHISERINKAYSMLWLIRRNFRHIRPAAFVLVYKHWLARWLCG